MKIIPLQLPPVAPSCKVISSSRVLGRLLFYRDQPEHAAKFKQLKADLESALGVKCEGIAFPMSDSNGHQT